MKLSGGAISIAVALVMAPLIGVPTAQASVTATTIAVSAGDNQAASPGTAVSTAPAVLVTGAGSVPVAGVSVTFTIASGGGSLASPGSPATVTTGSDGIATAPAWTLGATAGSNTLTATASGLTGSPVTFSATGTRCTNSGGAGSSDNPFQIATAADLGRITSYSECGASGLHYKQTADITLSGSWTPIGPDLSTPFRGTYDGDSKSISGLTATGAYLGLFSHTIDATLKNIRLLGVSLAVNGNFAGGLVARAQNTDILNCFASGAITVTDYLADFGGIAGRIETGSLIQDTSSEVSVTTAEANYVGGVVGRADQSELIRVTYSGSLTTASTSTVNHSWLGGIAGWAGDTSIQNASSSGSVSGFNNVGGIVGTLQSGAPNVTLMDSSSSATVTGNSLVGGLVGYAPMTSTGDLTISGSRASGTVSGRQRIGGLVGYAPMTSTGDLTISGSRATGAVSGQEDVGGLAGEIDARTSATATVEDSYATGNVTATYAGTSNTGSQAGGLAGTLLGNTTVRRSYATGGVTAWRYLGGLVGEAQGTTSPATSVTITDSFATGAPTLTSISVAPPGDTVTPGYAGSLVGAAATSTIQNSYAVGWIGTLNLAVGGVMGTTYADTTISGVQWNTQTTGTSYAGYSPAYPGPMSGTTGLTTSQMRFSTNFPGWNFSTVWGYDCSTSIYPQLRSLNSSATATSCPEPPPDSGGSGNAPTPVPTPTPTPTSTVAPAAPPEVAPGGTSMTIGGREVEVTTTEGRRGAGLTLTAGPVSLTLRGTTPKGQGVPLTSDGSLILPRSGQVPTQVLGLAANTPVTQTLYSDPITLASSAASSSGTFSASATLPSTLPLGPHTLSLSGTTDTGLPFTLSIGVVVATPAAALGADPVLSATPRTVAPHDRVVVTARGVQAGCRVTVSSGRDRQYVTASKTGTAEATVVVGPMTRKQWPITATVTGKGCTWTSTSTSVKVTQAPLH